MFQRIVNTDFYSSASSETYYYSYSIKDTERQNLMHVEVKAPRRFSTGARELLLSAIIKAYKGDKATQSIICKNLALFYANNVYLVCNGNINTLYYYIERDAAGLDAFDPKLNYSKTYMRCVINQIKRLQFCKKLADTQRNQ